MNTLDKIKSGKCSLGIEFGSTRIKAILIDEDYKSVASGSYVWENTYVNGLWTYSQKQIIEGLKGVYSDLNNNINKEFSVKLKRIKSLGVSGMMHGYIALSKENEFLVPFRTWRNTITQTASERLTKLFNFPVPQRWTVAHLYQAILNKENHVKQIDYLTTLAGYVHYLLTGKRVVGIGEASGIFPIDVNIKTYDKTMLRKFQEICNDVNLSVEHILPEVMVAGQNAGILTEEGARLLDESGNLECGCFVCPPEGDAGTGMVATNAVRERTGNVSAGTSVFSMYVLEKPLKNVYEEIDIVTTPDGKDVAMVHCNNCTSDINAWVNLFGEFADRCGCNISADELYKICFDGAEKGSYDCGGLVSFNNISGEPITKVENGRPMLIREGDKPFRFDDLVRVNIYSSCAALKIGSEILTKNESVVLDRLMGHGGLFKTGNIGQRIMASALGVPISVFETASEGGAWGMAVLAQYASLKDKKPLADFLDENVFVNESMNIAQPEKAITDGFNKFMDKYKKELILERIAGKSKDKKAVGYEDIRKRVYDANMQLVEYGLVILTWGNASEIDRDKKIIAIKPSGVDYSIMKPEDIVITDLDGNVIDGDLRPSSDLKTHVELYKAFPNIKGVVHTHSTCATMCAQTGECIPCYGTTHADYFYGDVPCTRSLSKEEITSDYERNTGKVIVEYFKDNNLDYNACPAVLIKNHAPFTWGNSAKKAVENAYVLEQVAKMAIGTKLYKSDVKPADKYLADKHYFRKHGKNAYYGQIKK